MPGGSKLPSTSIYNKYQNGEWAFDTELRAKVVIAGVSAAVTFPGGGVSHVHLVGGTTNQDVRLAAVSSIVVPVSGNVTANFAQTSTRGVAVLTTSGASGTVEAVAAGGANTKTEVRGFSICNEGANLRRFELRFGTTGTAFWRGSLAASGGAFNWNMIGHYQISANNKAIRAYMNGAGTATVTVYYRYK